MQAVYRLLVRELELEALKLRQQLEQKKRRVKFFQRMAEIERLNQPTNHEHEHVE